MGWTYDFHIRDDMYNGTVASFGRGGCADYDWRIDIIGGGDDEMREELSIRFTTEDAVKLCNWVVANLASDLRWKDGVIEYHLKEVRDLSRKLANQEEAAIKRLNEMRIEREKKRGEEDAELGN